MNKRAWVAATIVVGAVASSAGVEDARACGSEYAPYIEVPVREAPKRDVPLGVSTAEKNLAEGRWADAARSVAGALPGIRAMTPGKDALVNRGLKALALATVRAEGTLPIGQPWSGKSPAERTANLEWAVATLRATSKLKGDDPVATTDLGEALAKLWAHQGEARTLLEGLAKGDLMTSPEGWAALARVRSWAGDPLGRDQATARCRAMSNKEGVCERTAGAAAAAAKERPKAGPAA